MGSGREDLIHIEGVGGSDEKAAMMVDDGTRWWGQAYFLRSSSSFWGLAPRTSSCFTPFR
jgi:hypothetical protein